MSVTAMVVNESTGGVTWVCAEPDPMCDESICGREVGDGGTCPVHVRT